jgi:hypothetical protein
MDVTQYIVERENVNFEDIGMYLRLIHMDYQPETYDEMANMICEQFNVNCTARNIKAYEELHIEYEDMQKMECMSEIEFIEYNT